MTRDERGHSPAETNFEKSEAGLMIKNRPFVVVSIATIPSRIASIEPTIKSLFDGLLPPDRVVVCTPEYCALEKSGYVIPDFLADGGYGDRVIHVVLDRDWGPGTKILGPLAHVPPLDSLLVIADDDVIYHREFLSRLIAAQIGDQSRSSSFYVYRSHGLPIATGCDGHAMWATSLIGIRDFAEKHVWGTSLLYHDDIWIAFFLAASGIEVRPVRLPDGVDLIYDQILANDVLSAQSGDLKRELIASTHLPRLFREVPLSGKMRLKLGAMRWADLAVNTTWRAINKARRMVTESR